MEAWVRKPVLVVVQVDIIGSAYTIAGDTSREQAEENHNTELSKKLKNIKLSIRAQAEYRPSAIRLGTRLRIRLGTCLE